MARLIVKLRGEEVTRMTLESGMEYIAGRAGDAQIALANERGISRHHLKFYERDGIWVCESLSKFVLIQQGSQSVEVLELSEPTAFAVPPYDFVFEPDSASASQDAATPSENLPAFYQPRANMSEDTSPRLNNEATVAGVVTLVPYIRISYPNTADDEVLKLEGHLWVAGRDPASEIPIDSAHVSRKHFELARMKEGFFITDLGSSNGTKLNGQRIPPHEPTRIESGDEIRVMTISMSFEIRDNQFSNRMDSLPVPSFDPMLAAPPAPWYPEMPAMPVAAEFGPLPIETIPRDPRKWRPHHLKQVNWKKHKVRVAIGVVVVLMLVMGLTDDGQPKVARDPAKTSGQSVVFENLTPEQKSSVKDSFNLARALYVQGKYELCLAELAKVHELIPQYENSKELQSFCEQGRELVNRQRDLERKERERAMIEQQITGYVETCKAKLTPNSTVEETRQCLADAVELNPEHHLIVEMLHTASMHEEERKFLAQQKEKENARREEGIGHYQRAKNLWKKGSLFRAAREYEKFLDTEYPRLGNEKTAARRELATVKRELKAKVDQQLEQCRSFGQKNRYKDAYLACDEAVKEDPGNSEAKELREQMHSELKREMKSIYEDSVLEESLGNVDSAKEKWKKIMRENLDFDDYTKKAKGKLRKYGVGM